MSRTHRLTDPAIDDLIDVADFYDRQTLGLGDDVRLEARALVRRLTAQPFIFAAIDRPPRGRDIRTGDFSPLPGTGAVRGAPDGDRGVGGHPREGSPPRLATTPPPVTPRR